MKTKTKMEITDITKNPYNHILSTAEGFKKIAGKYGRVEYLILNFHLPREHVKSNVQSIGDTISF